MSKLISSAATTTTSALTTLHIQENGGSSNSMEYLETICVLLSLTKHKINAKIYQQSVIQKSPSTSPPLSAAAAAAEDQRMVRLRRVISEKLHLTEQNLFGIVQPAILEKFNFLMRDFEERYNSDNHSIDEDSKTIVSQLNKNNIESELAHNMFPLILGFEGSGNNRAAGNEATSPLETSHPPAKLNWSRMIALFHVVSNILQVYLQQPDTDEKIQTVIFTTADFVERETRAWMREKGGYSAILKYNEVESSEFREAKKVLSTFGLMAVGSLGIMAIYKLIRG